MLLLRCDLKGHTCIYYQYETPGGVTLADTPKVVTTGPHSLTSRGTSIAFSLPARAWLWATDPAEGFSFQPCGSEPFIRKIRPELYVHLQGHS